MITKTADTTERLTRLLRMAVWGGAGLLMLAPVVASFLTEEMNWSPFDFLLWGGMLGTGALAFEAAMRLSRNWAYRAGAVIAVGAAFLLVWVTLAVGIIGSEDHPANLLYMGVLGLGAVGAAVSAFRARGMAVTLAAMAAATVAIAVAALIAGWGSDAPVWPQVIIIANGFFAGAWTLSAELFRRAAKDRRLGMDAAPA
jgi:hypothetical protein